MPEVQQFQTVVNAVGWTLIHFLWQGCGIALVLWLICRLSRPVQARLRYRAGLGAYLACAVAPGITFLHVFRSSIAGADPGGLSLSGVSPVSGYHLSTGRFLEIVLEPALPAVVALWALGVGVLSSRTFLGWLGMRGLVRAGAVPVPEEWRVIAERLRTQLGVRRAVAVMRSTRVAIPTVVGWLKPVILMPAGVMARLPRDQLEMIIAHEIVHVRRNDYLVNLLQLIIETLFFYHPAVRWMSRQVRQEREHCCDDMVVAQYGKPVVYARALANLEVMRAPIYRVSVAATDGDLFHRVSRIVRRELPRRSAGFANVAVIAVAAAVAVASARYGIEMGRTLPDEPLAANANGALASTRGWGRLEVMGELGKGLLLHSDRPVPAPAPQAGSETLANPPEPQSTSRSLREVSPAVVERVTESTPSRVPTDGSGPMATSPFAGLPAAPLLLARAETPIEFLHRDQLQRKSESMPKATARPVSTRAPDYPYRAFRDGVEGYVKLQFTVSGKGRVRNVRVLEAEPSGVFEEAAVSALKRWRFDVESIHDPSLKLLQTFEFAALNEAGNTTQRHRRCNRTGSNICGQHYSEEHVVRFGPESDE